MSLNIKNDETCLLARDLARLTGETMTGAITVALRERLAREEASARREYPRRGTARHRAALRAVAGTGAIGPGARRPAV